MEELLTDKRLPVVLADQGPLFLLEYPAAFFETEKIVFGLEVLARKRQRALWAASGASTAFFTLVAYLAQHDFALEVGAGLVQPFEPLLLQPVDDLVVG